MTSQDKGCSLSASDNHTRRGLLN